jgi:hypothetical protein
MEGISVWIIIHWLDSDVKYSTNPHKTTDAKNSTTGLFLNFLRHISMSIPPEP